MQRPNTVSAGDQRTALHGAIDAAQAAGKLMRTNWRRPKKIDSQTQHDIKLELDVRCQKVIEQILGKSLPQAALLGEEGVRGDPRAALRWVVDPIDGTVNFTYGIPHACVSIALQQRGAEGKSQSRTANAQRPKAGVQGPESKGRDSETEAGDYVTIVGVVYDPFCDELWTATRGRPAKLNGRPIRVSAKRRLAEAIISVGFAKEKQSLERMLPMVNRLVRRVRKLRIMGSAALSLTYVASGRMDAYIEYGLRLWDIAAGGLILESAGGDFWHEPVPAEHRYRLLASNGALRRPLAPFQV